MFAAYLAQQQGISVASAIKKVDGPVCDEWLMVAELALLAHESRVGQFLADQTVYVNLRRPTKRSAEGGSVVDHYSSRLVQRTTDVVISRALEAGSATRFEK